MRGTDPRIQPLLRRHEQELAPTELDFKYRKFCLWIEAEAKEYCALMGRLLLPRGGCGEYRRYERYDEQNHGIEVCLQWYEAFRNLDKLPDRLRNVPGRTQTRSSSTYPAAEANGSRAESPGGAGDGSWWRSGVTVPDGARLVESPSPARVDDEFPADGDADLRAWAPPP